MKRYLVCCVALLVGAMSPAATIIWQSRGSDTTYLVSAEDGTKLSSVPDGGSIVLVKIVADEIATFLDGTWSAAAATELQTATIGGSALAKGKVNMTCTFDYAKGIISDGDYIAAVLKHSDGTYEQFSYYDGAKDGHIGAAVTDALKISGLKAQQDLFYTEYNFATAGNFIAVPEPASGMLLLLGMAGLALKRKRA